MKTTRKVLPLLAVGALLVAPSAHAFLIFFPLPNLAKPPELQRIIDTLEGSQEVKAVAFASEDKTFGSKMWVWGHHSGKVTQDEADRQALRACEDSLARTKAKEVGGKPLYDFGSKRCELHEFANKTVYTPPQPAPAQAPVVAQPPMGDEPKDSPIAAKLKELNDLKRQGLITEEEYIEKRKAILSSI